MTFYLDITPTQIKFGGIKSIIKDYAFISQTRSIAHVGYNDQISNPMGVWVIGGSVRANYVASGLRMCGVIRDSALCSISSENDVMIVVYTNDRLYLYRNGARSWQPVVDQTHRWSVGLTDDALDDLVKGIVPGREWDSTVTHYEVY